MQFFIREFSDGEEEIVGHLHKIIYRNEYGWGDSFIRYAVEIARSFPTRRVPGDHLWVAESDGKVVGSVMLCHTDTPEIGQLRLFIVDKPYRRIGIGSALLSTLLDEAKSLGYSKIILWTADPLTDAIKCYSKLGFSETESVANNEWSLSSKTIFEIKMELEL